jgi:hypothetical protein
MIENEGNGALRPFSIFHSPASFRYAVPMFDIVRPQISTAADKTAHLRRFL